MSAHFPSMMGYRPILAKHKDISYTRASISFESVEPTAKSVGAPHTSINADGTPKYTVPFIYDSTHQVAVSDSFLIAEYLDKAYPETPKVITTGSRAFADLVFDKFKPLLYVMAPKFREYMTPELIEGQRKAYGDAAVSIKLNREEEDAAWEQVHTNLERIKWEEGHHYVTGDKPVFEDFVLAAYVGCVQDVYGAESEEWREVSKWLDGQLGQLVEKICGQA
ncbi:hypothetical protein WG66_000907 [Moniliophthora roreri]|nr:hypothetical protein WG66_000907 [Moniliophthora roreri]